MANGTRVESGRVVLCPFNDAFWAPGRRWYNDPEIITLTSDDQSELTESEFRATIEADLTADHSVVFGIRDENEYPIGIGILRNIDPVHGGCELHITIGERRCWNQGYGAEAISAMRDYAFEVAGCHKVLSTPFLENPRMIRCLEKCGFEREGTLREALKQGDQFIDIVLMGLINPKDVTVS